ncbi:MAG: hypothetical protein GY861_05380 [bacterium]|nr:hypothetical protein [bacterium]
MARETITVTIEGKVITDGKEQAKAEVRSFSNYLEWLIIRDKQRIEHKK